jgi:hypothetical protein
VKVHIQKVRKTAKGKKLDFTTTALSVVERAIGERMDGSPLPTIHLEKKSPAQERGQMGGLKGGKARAEKLTAKQRKTIALKAAKARWKKA